MLVDKREEPDQLLMVSIPKKKPIDKPKQSKRKVKEEAEEAAATFCYHFLSSRRSHWTAPFIVDMRHET